jgi:hypothetical protein
MMKTLTVTAMIALGLLAAAPAQAEQYDRTMAACTAATAQSLGVAPADLNIRYNRFQTSGLKQRAWFTLRNGDTLTRGNCEFMRREATATIAWANGAAPSLAAASK